MELTTAVYLVLAVAVGAGFAYLMLRRDTPEGTVLSAGSYLERIQEAAAMAQILVQAAEQLAETGQLARDARFHYVYGRLHTLFPSLSEDTLIAVLEAAVWTVNQGVAWLAPPAGHDE